jgi:sugar lactone lactonase YvrE
MSEELFVSTALTAPGGFTDGIEGPACDREGVLYAVNFARQGTIGRVTPDGVCDVFVALPDGSVGNGIVFSRAGEMLIADYTGHSVLRVDMASRTVSVYAHDPRLNQPNDLAITADDIIFASDPSWARGDGQLWRVGADRRFMLLEAGMGTTNGVEVSADGRTLYVNETVQRRVWAYDLGPGGGLSNKRLLIEFPDFGLDGMRCDVAGHLYVTRWGKGSIVQLSPAGTVLREVALGGRRCTNLAFGGADGRTLYVTVADNGNIERIRTELPGRSWALWREGR